VTPLWVPLVVAGIGLLGTVVGTIAGVSIAQRRSDRRELAMWQRERIRQRELWQREDALRNFEHRREAYVSFYESLREMSRTAYDHGMGLSPPPPEEDDAEVPFEWNMATARKLEHLRLYASPSVLAAADAAYSACWRWGHLTRRGAHDDQSYDQQEIYNDTELALYDAVRRDLGLEGVIQPDGRPLPGSGWTADPLDEGSRQPEAQARGQGVDQKSVDPAGQ
jgi:hypothetical protein